MSNIGKEGEISSLSAGRSLTHRHSRIRYILFWVLVALTVPIIAAAACPVTTLETPRWDVWVVDGNGQPMAGMTVRMTYQNYSAEPAGHEQDLYTDGAGHVVFPARTITVSTLNRAIAVVRAAQVGGHASFGPHVHVFVFGHGGEGSAESLGNVTDWTGQPAEMESRIILL